MVQMLVFLALRIATLVLSIEHEQPCDMNKLIQEMENIIDKFPLIINKLRNINKSYTVPEAFKIIKDNLLPYEIETLPQCFLFFSEEGKRKLYEILSGDSIRTCILTVPPYSLLITKINFRIAVVDTHCIKETLGGNGNAIIRLFYCPRNCKVWLWCRFLSDGIRSSMQEFTTIRLLQDPLNDDRNNVLTERLEEVIDTPLHSHSSKNTQE